MRRMIDLLRAGKGLTPDGKPEAANAPWETGIARVIIADNVADYTRDRNLIVEDLPCLRPPWNSFWIEYPSTSGGERRGVLCYDAYDLATQEAEEPDSNNMIDGLIEAAIKDAEKNGHHRLEVKACLGLAVHIGERDRTIGPVALMTYALNHSGRAIGNRWVLHPKLRDGLGKMKDPGMWALAAAAPALQTIAFLHCKNAVMETSRPEVAVSRKWQKRTGNPLTTYQTVRLDLPRKSSRSTGRKGTGIEQGLHIVAGHFAHYGDCCPEEHEVKGKLFGKHEGIYWIPGHARGSTERGPVLHDFEVKPIKVDAPNG